MNDKNIILCADDFALSAGVSSTICELIQMGRISATSCMTVFPEWYEHASWLKPSASLVDVGLHLTLTDQVPLSSMAYLAPDRRLPRIDLLVRKAYLGRLDRQEIEIELNRQFDTFVDAFGQTPDFLDGHQHVHQLPIVRDIVIDIYCKRMKRGYIRSCTDQLRWIYARKIAVAKSTVINLMGQTFLSDAKRKNISMNDGFSGIYKFEMSTRYSEMFKRFLMGTRPNSIIMCHPAKIDKQLKNRDSMVGVRAGEWEFLKSDLFLETMSQSRVNVARFTA